MRYRYYTEQQLACSTKATWDFFSLPFNLSKITPKDMSFIVTSGLSDQPIYEGMEIEYTVSPLFKIPLKWETKITKVKFQESFTDIQVKGPYKYWSHFHEFEPNEKGVLVKDCVEYELHFGFLGRIAHQLLVKKKLESIFNYRYQVLESLFNQNNQLK